MFYCKKNLYIDPVNQGAFSMISSSFYIFIKGIDMVMLKREGRRHLNIWQ